MGQNNLSGLEMIDPDAPDLKRLWIATGDIQFPAMAIGRWPADPPPWAVIACYAEHQRWQQRTTRGNTNDQDGMVLDEVIRVYFRFEDEARGQGGYSTKTYKPPARSRVIAIALLHVEGLNADSPSLRSRIVAIERRLDEEAKIERVTERAADGAHRTARYDRILHDWGRVEIGGPDYLHALLKYLSKIVQENESGSNTILR